MEVVAFSVQGFLGHGAPVEVRDAALLRDMLRGPCDARKSALLQGIRTFRHLTAHGPLPHCHLIARLPNTLQHLTPDPSAPIVVASEVITGPDDYKNIGSPPTQLKLDRLRVALKISWYDLTMAPGYSVIQFETADGIDIVKTPDWAKIKDDVAIGTGLLYLAMTSLLNSIQSPPPDAWAGNEKPILTDTEHRVLNTVAEYRLGQMAPTPYEDLDRRCPAELAESLDSALQSLASKGCIEQTGDTSDRSFELTPTGLLACAWGGESAGLAMGVLEMMKHRATQEGTRFAIYNFDQVRPFIYIPGEHHPFAATVIDILRLAEAGTWGPWVVPPMKRLKRISNIRDLRLLAEEVRREEAIKAATEADAQHRAAEIAANATSGGTAIAAGRDVNIALVDGTVAERVIAGLKSLLGRQKRGKRNGQNRK